MDAELDRLKEELSRTVAHRCSLQEALAAAEGDRETYRNEMGRQRTEIQRLHAAVGRMAAREADLLGALNVARAERDSLKGGAAPASPAPPAAEASKAPEKAVLRALPAASVIEVRDLCKSYRLPAQPVETLKERIAHPLRSMRSTRLEALRDVSFDVQRGEFFGIAGANGSGKSTLLKLLANVYAADSGKVRTAGRVAPFIELGVGLNPEFAAYDNVVISGVMMGLEPEEARARYPEIIEFAGLGEFTELKLKNYSSGMRVRLAFAVMAQVDADILLVDEVLAVGDAEFREKCLARMSQLREEGTTIVLVTHSMETIAKECDRAILLAKGRVIEEGDPAAVARRYLREQRNAVREDVPAPGSPVVRLVQS
ncbi:MAG TPA: ABC transporter ATP-binding protein [Solirubrobacterales bacterium]|nr:ABC transporter ATP-binding protein [Solirubrobacterales bacterium]